MERKMHPPASQVEDPTRGRKTRKGKLQLTMETTTIALRLSFLHPPVREHQSKPLIMATASKLWKASAWLGESWEEGAVRVLEWVGPGMKRRSLWKPRLHITLLVAAMRVQRSWDWSPLFLFLFLLFLLTFRPLCSIHLHPIQTKTPYDLLMAFLSTILPLRFFPLPFLLSHHHFLPSLKPHLLPETSPHSSNSTVMVGGVLVPIDRVLPYPPANFPPDGAGHGGSGGSAPPRGGKPQLSSLLGDPPRPGTVKEQFVLRHTPPLHRPGTPGAPPPLLGRIREGPSPTPPSPSTPTTPSPSSPAGEPHPHLSVPNRLPLHTPNQRPRHPSSPLPLLQLPNQHHARRSPQFPRGSLPLNREPHLPGTKRPAAGFGSGPFNPPKRPLPAPSILASQNEC